MKKKKSVHNLTAYVLRRGNSMDDSYGNPAFWTSVGQGKGERVVVFFFFLKINYKKKVLQSLLAIFCSCWVARQHGNGTCIIEAFFTARVGNGGWRILI